MRSLFVLACCMGVSHQYHLYNTVVGPDPQTMVVPNYYTPEQAYEIRRQLAGQLGLGLGPLGHFGAGVGVGGQGISVNTGGNLFGLGGGVAGGLGWNGVGIQAGAGVGAPFTQFGLYRPVTREDIEADMEMARNLGVGVGLQVGPLGGGVSAGLDWSGVNVGGGAGFSNYYNYGTPQNWQQHYQ